MAVEPAWIGGLLVAAEVAAFRQFVQCLRAPGRYPDDRRDIKDSIDDGYAYALKARLADVVKGVLDLRDPGHQTEDGDVEPEPIEDVLARADLDSDCTELTQALSDVLGARTAARRCRTIHYAEAVALVPTMVLLPVPLWPVIADASILTGPLLHVANTVLAIAAFFAVVLYFAAIHADNILDKALVAQGPRRERIGA